MINFLVFASSKVITTEISVAVRSKVMSAFAFSIFGIKNYSPDLCCIAPRAIHTLNGE